MRVARANRACLRTAYEHRARAVLKGIFAAILVATGSLVGLPAAAAHADSGEAMVSLINLARSSSGLSALIDNASLDAVAQGQAGRMAASGILAHNPTLRSAVCCWTGLGENVGVGPSIQNLDSAFLASPEHRANILGKYDQVGVGVATDPAGRVWVSEVFRLIVGAPPVTVVVPPPVATPRPPKPAPVRVSLPVRRTVTAKPQGTARTTPLPARIAQVPAVSRSLPAGRLPIAAAQEWATRWVNLLLVPTPTVSDVDPVASVLSFAAQTAASASTPS